MSINKDILIDTIKEVVNKKNRQSGFKDTSKIIRKLNEPEVKQLDKEESRKYSVQKRKRNNTDHPLRRIRIARGLTLDDLAKKVNMSTSYISRIEGGSRRLNSDIIRLFSAALDCRPADLLDFDGEETVGSGVDNILMQKDDVRTNTAANINQGGFAKDLPLFSFKGENIDRNKVSDWVIRPYELNGDKEAYSIVVKGDFLEPRYKNMEMLFISSTKNLTENCSVVLTEKNGNVTIGDYLGWSMKGKNSEISDEDRAIIKSYATGEEISVRRADIESLQRIIGTMES